MSRTDVFRPVLQAAAAPGRLFVPVFCLLLLAAAAPVFTDEIPPLADYVNHLARMRVIAGIGNDPALARLYEIDWAIIPNLVMDLLVPPLLRITDIYTAGQLFVFATLALLATGPLAVHRALYGRLSPWPLVVFPFLYNGIFLFGFMNYLFGVGVATWALAGWIACRERSPLLRGTLSAVAVLALFACHLFAVGLYGLALLSVEGWLLSRSWPGIRTPAGRRRIITDALAFGLPFLPVIPLMLASPTLGLSTENIWESSGKLDGLLFIIQGYWDTFDLTVAGLVAAGVIWAIRRNLLSLHPMGLVFLVLGTAVFMAMPRMLFGSWVADTRLPVALLFLIIGFIRFDADDRAVRTAFYAFLVGVALVRFVDVQVNWQALRHVNTDMQESMHLIDPGSSVLVAHADQPVGNEMTNQALSHAPCIAMIERSALVSTAFSVPGKQVLSIRPEYRDLVDDSDGDPPTVSQLLASADEGVPGQPHYWDTWPTRYDYLYVLFTEGNSPNPDPAHLTLLHQGPQFQLFKVHPDLSDLPESE